MPETVQLSPTIAQKIRETIETPVEHTGLCSGTIAEALRDKNGTTGMTIAAALDVDVSQDDDQGTTTPEPEPGANEPTT